jgi:isoprenylcysteine carboxyl methyltransferase (ICMT) family protein YpbQ
MSQIQRLASAKVDIENKEEIIEEKLKEVYSRNDKTVALLYNLVFLRLLIKIYGAEDLYQRVNDIVYYYQNMLVSLLVTM